MLAFVQPGCDAHQVPSLALCGGPDEGVRWDDVFVVGILDLVAVADAVGGGQRPQVDGACDVFGRPDGVGGVVDIAVKGGRGGGPEGCVEEGGVQFVVGVDGEDVEMCVLEEAEAGDAVFLLRGMRC